MVSLWKKKKKEETDSDSAAADGTREKRKERETHAIKPLSLPQNPVILRNPGWLERVVEGAFYCGCA